MSVKPMIICTAAALLLQGPDCFGVVQTGLDNVKEYKHLFDGKRIGIITNHTGLDTAGRHVVDVFKNMPGVKVTALFSPEHGLYGTEKAGGKIDNIIHPVYRLPVYSLYGQTHKPTPAMLKDVDILVFDIQAVGARFYTYIYTMSLSMEAAAQCGKVFIVLDRPNPINGVQTEGSVLEREFAGFVGLHPIAVRHGMTAGELAKMFNEEGWLAGGVKADLTIIPMKGWRREMWFDETGLQFVKPSPNIVNIEAAVVYPGLCLLEGTNVSEGRGSDRPFLQFGAPWIDAEEIAAQLNELHLPGLRFEPIQFTPKSSKYAAERCRGAGIVIENRDTVEAYFSGIRIVNTIHRMYPRRFRWKAGHFDRLCGTDSVRKAISGQSDLETLRESWQPRLKAFRQIRKKYLIYQQ